MEKAITRFPAYSDCVSIVVGGIHEFFYCVVGTARIYIHGDNERVRALVIRFDGGGENTATVVEWRVVLF